jgi:hypothetical protein
VYGKNKIALGQGFQGGLGNNALTGFQQSSRKPAQQEPHSFLRRFSVRKSNRNHDRSRVLAPELERGDFSKKAGNKKEDTAS